MICVYNLYSWPYWTFCINVTPLTVTMLTAFFHYHDYVIIAFVITLTINLKICMYLLHLLAFWRRLVDLLFKDSGMQEWYILHLMQIYREAQVRKAKRWPMSESDVEGRRGRDDRLSWHRPRVRTERWVQLCFPEGNGNLWTQNQASTPYGPKCIYCVANSWKTLLNMLCFMQFKMK